MWVTVERALGKSAPEILQAAPDLCEAPLRDADAAERLQHARDEKRFLTVRISETTRALAFGMLALYYGLVSSNTSFAAAKLASHPIAIRIMGATGICALLSDYLQYLFGRFAVSRALKRVDHIGVYDDDWLEYRARSWAFWTKQAIIIVGATTAIWALGF